MKVSSFFLALYAFTFSLFSGISEYTYIEDLVGGIFVVTFIIEYIANKGYKFPWNNLINFLLIFYFWALVAILLQPQAFRKFITFTLVLVLFYTVFCITKTENKFSGILYGLVFGLLTVFIMYYEQILSVSAGISTERFAGTMNANNFSFLLAVTIAFLLKPVFGKKNIEKYKLVLIGSLVTLFSYVVIMIIGSRRGIIMLFVIALWTYLYLFRSRSWIYKISISFLFVAIFTILVIWLQESVFYNRFEMLLAMFSEGGTESKSLTLRSKMFWTGLELWKEKPLVGWGFDAFRYESGFNTYAHNNYIELLTNHGIIGFSLYYFFTGAIFYKSYKEFKYSCSQDKGIYSWVMLLIALLLVGDTAVVSLQLKINWIVLAISLAMISNSKK